MPMILDDEPGKPGSFKFERNGEVVTINHRALNPTIDIAVASDRAFSTAARIRNGQEAQKTLGFHLPDGFGVRWSVEDWTAFSAMLVQIELCVELATDWEGVVDKAGAPFIMSGDAIRTLFMRNNDLYLAWCKYAAYATVAAAEGNASALSLTTSSAGEQPTVEDVPNSVTRARKVKKAPAVSTAQKRSTPRKPQTAKRRGK